MGESKDEGFFLYHVKQAFQLFCRKNGLAFSCMYKLEPRFRPLEAQERATISASPDAQPKTPDNSALARSQHGTV